MLWAIDVGNTQTVVGIWDGSWVATWRLSTVPSTTEDDFAANLRALCDLAGIKLAGDQCVVASVVPSFDDAIARFSRKWLGVEAKLVKTGQDVGLKVTYDPPHSVGADRLVNAIAALAIAPPPILIVDFGTATTFDAIDSAGVYVGGAIMPGPVVSAEALSLRTAKLPRVQLVPPSHAVGRTTTESLQSGMVLGYADAIEGLVTRMSRELGKAAVIATGGLGEMFAGLCPSIGSYNSTLTLDGLVLAAGRLH